MYAEEEKKGKQGDAEDIGLPTLCGGAESQRFRQKVEEGRAEQQAGTDGEKYGQRTAEPYGKQAADEGRKDRNNKKNERQDRRPEDAL